MRAGYTCKRKTSPSQSHEAIRLELVNGPLLKPQDGVRIRQLLVLCMEREASVATSKARALSVGTTLPYLSISADRARRPDEVTWRVGGGPPNKHSTVSTRRSKDHAKFVEAASTNSGLECCRRQEFAQHPLGTHLGVLWRRFLFNGSHNPLHGAVFGAVVNNRAVS
jgi:hypothetical protein